MTDLNHFRQVVAANLGKVLTPEAAAAIEDALREPARPVDISGFAPLEHGGYVIAVERMADVLDELHGLHERHWQETEKHRHGLPLAPDYDAMLADERGGSLVQFTVRQAGALVGNLRMYLRTSRHSGTLFAQEDTLYLLPEHRGGFVSMHLLRYAERALAALGAREIRASSKLVNNADVLLRRLQYKAVAMEFVKVF